MEEIGKHKGSWTRLCEVLQICMDGKSYYVRDIENHKTYLRNRKKLYPNCKGNKAD